ncbi:MAG TPA: hypothetical protein VM142_00610 [Acidimicrobiales bacterium]|nr:hypothetical protein [Acidimicrobiales bacterium]
MTVKKAHVLVGFSVIVGMLGMMSTAWACWKDYAGGQPVVSAEPNRGVPGAVITAGGENWPAGAQVSVGLSTDSRSVGQQVAVATVTDQSLFQVQFNVPSVTPGNYYVTAKLGSVITATTFDVTGAVDRRSTGSTNPDGTATGTLAGAPGDERPSTPAPSPSPAGGPTAVGGFPSQADQPATGQPATGRSSAGSDAAPANSTLAQAQPGSQPAASANTRTAAAPALIGGDPEPATRSSEVESGAVTGSDTLPSVSSRTALGDLWGGFANGDSAATVAPGLDTPTPGGASPLVLGMEILLAGLASLLGGFAWVETRRRRATVVSTRQS